MNLSEFRAHLANGRWSKKSSARIAIGQAFKGASTRTKNTAIAEADAYFDQIDNGAQQPADADVEEESVPNPGVNTSRLSDLVLMISNPHMRRALIRYLKKSKESGLTVDRMEQEVEVLSRLVE